MSGQLLGLTGSAFTGDAFDVVDMLGLVVVPGLAVVPGLVLLLGLGFLADLVRFLPALVFLLGVGVLSGLLLAGVLLSSGLVSFSGVLFSDEEAGGTGRADCSTRKCCLAACERCVGFRIIRLDIQTSVYVYPE